VWDSSMPESSESIYSGCLPGLDDWNDETAWSLDDLSPRGSIAFGTPTAVTTPISAELHENNTVPFFGSISWAASDVREFPKLVSVDNNLDSIQLGSHFHSSASWGGPPGSKSVQENDTAQFKLKSYQFGLGNHLNKPEPATVLQSINNQSTVHNAEDDTTECNIKNLSTVLSDLCKGLETIQCNQASAADVAFSCLEDFASSTNSRSFHLHKKMKLLVSILHSFDFETCDGFSSYPNFDSLFEMPPILPSH
jgi:hypothetical protein